MAHSPPSIIFVLAVALLCMEVLLTADEIDQVLGRLTAVESAAEAAAVLMLVVDPGPVRRANAARQGHGVEFVLGWRTGAVPLLLERCWLSDGRRSPPHSRQTRPLTLINFLIVSQNTSTQCHSFCWSIGLVLICGAYENTLKRKEKVFSH